MNDGADSCSATLWPASLGGAIGLAAINTVLNDQLDLHLARLHEAVNWARQPAVETLDKLTQRFQDFGSDAQLMAMKQLMGIVRQQATVMAFADIFLMLTVLFSILAALSLVMKRPKIAGGGGGGH